MNAMVGRVGVAVLLAASWAAGAAGQPPPGVTPIRTLEPPAGAERPEAPQSRSPRVLLEIGAGNATWGRVVLELDTERTPQTVENFLHHVDSGFYDGTVFHRVLSGFLVQGGGYTAALEAKREGVRRPVANEARRGLKNGRGTVAMARGRDPHGATTQFFVNLADNPKLDHPGHDGWGYCVFGRVVQGMDVIDRVAKVPTRRDPRQRDTSASLPLEPPVIRRAYRLSGADAEAPGPSVRTPAPPPPRAPPIDPGDEDRIEPEPLPEPPENEEPEGAEHQPSEHEHPN